VCIVEIPGRPRPGFKFVCVCVCVCVCDSLNKLQNCFYLSLKNNSVSCNKNLYCESSNQAKGNNGDPSTMHPRFYWGYCTHCLLIMGTEHPPLRVRIFSRYLLSINASAYRPSHYQWSVKLLTATTI
jgi:hypothetical protein